MKPIFYRWYRQGLLVVLSLMLGWAI